MKRLVVVSIMVSVLLSGCGFPAGVSTEPENKQEGSMMIYQMPAESLPHEGTWIIWPHQYTYGKEYRDEIEYIWIQMVQALHTGEKVHIIAYDKTEQHRIENQLRTFKVDMKQIDFVIARSDDVWVRDTGPMFVYDENNRLFIADFGFDGWGKKVPYKNDDKIPALVGSQKNIPVMDIPGFVLEGGAVELDGSGTLMAALSSVVSKNRNSDLSVKDAEAYLSRYFGIHNFIWLDGVIDEDITDAHIDGMARFLDDSTILTVSEKDFAQLYEGINMDDYAKLKSAKNAAGIQYKIKTLPLTKEIVKSADCYGTYLNYYIGNKVVLVPVYEDENDEKALDIIGGLYPEREIVPIVVNDLFQYGGMLHCVTQQHPQ